MNTIPIRRRERDAVLQSLQAGLVPRQGLHLIQVGRKSEIMALVKDLERIADGGAAFRVIVGRFGSGKTFFLAVVCNLAFKKNLVVARADFTMERRLYATTGQAQALYRELVRNLSTAAQPDGGALTGILAAWISKLQSEAADEGGAGVDARLAEDLRDLQGSVGGFEFAEVVRAYYRGYIEHNDRLQAASLRWLRAEYETKSEARAELGVRRIIDDESFYSSLKLMAAFVRKAGFGGLLVSLDELIVLSHRLPNTRARQTNYETLLTILNDSLQGNAHGLGFIFAGTNECVENKDRGLFSYEALRSRLAEHRLSQQSDLVDLSGPIMRLPPLTPEDFFVLLKNIARVHAGGDPANIVVSDDGITAVMRKASERLGAEYFRTPRDLLRSFITLLNLLDQNPGKTWQEVLNDCAFEKASPVSAEDSDLISLTVDS